MTLTRETLEILRLYVELDKELVEATMSNDYHYSSQLRMQQHVLWLMLPQSAKESGIVDRWLNMYI